MERMHFVVSRKTTKRVILKKYIKQAGGLNKIGQ